MRREGKNTRKETRRKGNKQNKQKGGGDGIKGGRNIKKGRERKGE